MGIPYTGSGVMASAVGMDKWRTKLLWQAVGLPVPDFVMLDASSDFSAVERRLGLPLFVKPASEGSSIGVSKVREAGALAAAFGEAVTHDRLVIAEQGILGGEYTVAILGDEALPIIRIVPATDFYDYDAKYLRDDTKYICPCGLPEAREAELRAQALEAFRVLGCRGWGRVDFLMDEAGKAYFLEVNTRLQVEHGVTEEVTGLDLVEWMVRQAAGELDLASVVRHTSGASIQVRLYSEDPGKNFQPATGVKTSSTYQNRVGKSTGSHGGSGTGHASGTGPLQ